MNWTDGPVQGICLNYRLNLGFGLYGGPVPVQGGLNSKANCVDGKKKRYICGYSNSLIIIVKDIYGV